MLLIIIIVSIYGALGNSLQNVPLPNYSGKRIRTYIGQRDTNV